MTPAPVGAGAAVTCELTRREHRVSWSAASQLAVEDRSFSAARYITSGGESGSGEPLTATDVPEVVRNGGGGEGQPELVRRSARELAGRLRERGMQEWEVAQEIGAIGTIEE